MALVTDWWLVCVSEMISSRTRCDVESNSIGLETVRPLQPTRCAEYGGQCTGDIVGANETLLVGDEMVSRTTTTATATTKEKEKIKEIDKRKERRLATERTTFSSRLHGDFHGAR